MTPPGVVSYGLLDNTHCQDCGRPKLARLFALGLTGCEQCDEVITRHRCSGRPSSDSVFPGTRWKCPVCASAWVAREREEPCGHCGQPVVSKCWDIVDDRRHEGPRTEPQPFTPFRDLGMAAQMAAERKDPGEPS